MNLVVTAAGIIGLSVAASVLGLWLARRIVPHERLAPHNDVSGFVYAVIGVVYTVIIAFVLISVWERYSEAEATARMEADALGNLYRLAEGLPEPSREALQAATLDYARTVVAQEWPMLRDGDAPGARELGHTDALWEVLIQAEASTPEQEQFLGAALEQLDELSTHRRDRLAEAESGLLGILWAVMIGGGVLTVLFPCLFGVENGLVHALVVGILAATIGLLLLTVDQLNHPFEGPVQIEPDAFELVLEQFGSGWSRNGDVAALEAVSLH
jgi:AcrR family transcriptional regulator